MTDFTDFKKVSRDFINKLVKKYDKGEEYTAAELINCFCCTKEGIYITCFNESGDCYIEEFRNFNTVVDYFTTDKDIATLYDQDNKVYNDPDDPNGYCSVISLKELKKALKIYDTKKKKTPNFFTKLFKKRTVR